MTAAQKTAYLIVAVREGSTGMLAAETVVVDLQLVITVLVIIVLILLAFWLWRHR